MMELPPELCPGLCLAQYPTSPGGDSRGVGPPLHVLYRSLLVRAALHAVEFMERRTPGGANYVR